jgi:hypothetical protein
MPDTPFYALEPLPEETVERLRTPIGAVLAVLPETPSGVWYRFRFDLCYLPCGARAVHTRLYPVEAPELDIHEVSPEWLTSPLIPTKS